MRIFTILSLALVISVPSLSFAGQRTEELQAQFTSLVSVDLLRLQQSEMQNYNRLQVTTGKSVASQIKAANDQAVSDLNAYDTGRVVEGRRNFITRAEANELLYSINQHPVVSSYTDSKYSRENVEIGFCFGRATYLHLALLSKSINKDYIKKIWAVGNMKTGSINWAFHVAIVVKGEDGKWWTIDNVTGDVISVEQWMSEISKFEHAGTQNRYYFTEPQKFSISLGTYDRVQLGLDLNRGNDWYQGYFTDLMKWFADQSREKKNRR